MKTYVLNTPIITNFGTFKFEEISKEKATEILNTNSFTSAIGHEGTSKFLSDVLGVVVPFNRLQIVMEKDDHAIVFRVLGRLPEGKVLSDEELKSIPYQIGLMEKIE